MIGPGKIENPKIENIGNLTDLVSVPYSEYNSILAFLHTGYYHIHGAAFIYPDKANPVQVTSSAAAWSETGAITTIIPANAITKDFDLHFASVSDISATLYGIIDVFKDIGAGWVKIGPLCDVVRTSNFSRENQIRVQVSQIEANAAIGVRFVDNTASARSIFLKLYGHVYSNTL